MRHAIVDKLRAELEKGVKTEAQVVHILVEIRKLMEYSERRKFYLPLQFFCDWALHTKLDRKHAFEPLREIDGAIERKETAEQVAARIGHKFSLDVFRDDLIHFLIDHLLPVDPVRKAASWIRFLQRYVDVVSDCPIQSDRVQLKHVDKIVLNMSHEPPDSVAPNVAFVYTIRWTFWKDKNEVFTWANEVYRSRAAGSAKKSSSLAADIYYPLHSS